MEEARAHDVEALANEPDEGRRTLRRQAIAMIDSLVAHLDNRPASIPEAWVESRTVTGETKPRQGEE